MKRPELITGNGHFFFLRIFFGVFDSRLCVILENRIQSSKRECMCKRHVYLILLEVRIFLLFKDHYTKNTV